MAGWKCGGVDVWTNRHVHTSSLPHVHAYEGASPRSGRLGRGIFLSAAVFVFHPTAAGTGIVAAHVWRVLHEGPSLVVSPLRGFLPLFRPALSFVHRLLCRLGFSLFLPLVLLVPAFIVVDDVDGETQRELRNSPVSCDGVLRNPKRNDAACEGWIRRPCRGS